MKLLNKRLVSFLLAVVMLLGMMPMTVFATEPEHTHTYENSICTGCGATVSPYLQQLPEDIIGCTNLYDSLVPVKGYYTATKYDTSNGDVLSVVIPVEPGDQIAASSFGSVSENMGSVNGIRVTYLLGDEIVTSLSPSEVYSGYISDGYITVPDGVNAICVPWWKPSDSNWLTLSQISKDFTVHSPKTVSAQAPTCTERGYTAGEICEVCNASLGEREEIPPTGHTYNGDTCTVCGAVNIEAILGGKYVSILGDSISTFNGYSNDATVNTTIGGNGPRYDAGTADTKPGSYCLLESVDQTWWMHFANRSGMKLLVNNSWAGSQVFGGQTSDGRVIPAAYLDRCVNLHDNTLENNPGNAPINPDVIFVYLGINDYNFNRSNVGTGTVDYAGLVSSDGTYTTPATFGEAYGIMLHKMCNTYPDAQIFAMTLLPENLYSVDKAVWEQHNAYIRAAAEYYDIPVVDLAEKCAITWENYSGYMIDKIHPTTAGMELISDCIEAELVSYYKENPPHTHLYESTTTAPTCTEQGYTTYTCTLCGDSYVDDYVNANDHTYENGICTGCGVKEWDTDGDDVLEILAIGNSFSVDALQYAYQIAHNLGIEEIAIGNLYIGGCTLETHAANAAGDLGKYTYYFNDNGTWTSTGNYKISTAIESRSWDYISLQQGSPVSGAESSYNEDLTNLIAYVQERSDAKLVWHMTWAYQQNSTHSAFPTYGSDQMTMYNAIVSAVQNKIVTNENFDLLVPNGTAVQNSRTSLLGDTTTRDGYHMSYDYGRYLTGLLFIKTVTGLSIDNITYAPSGVDAEEKAIAIEAANNAFETPFEVTQSTYIEEEPVIPDEGYILLKPELYQGAYWNPTDSTSYNTIITTASNSSKYFATIRFTRETLPVGSIIILEDGWQYRPDGWITDAVQSSRADTTTESYVLVTEEWWGDYTIRSFNISKVGLPSLANVTEEEVRAAFRIYVPEAAHAHLNSAVVTAPTCTEAGYTTYTCTCGDSYVDDYVDAAGHSWSDGVCAVCGEVKKPYQRLTYFTVQVETDSKTYTDNAVLYLPANYSPDGEPVKLVIFCKQGSSQITSSSTPIESVGFYNYLISLGYAVLGVDGVPDVWRDELGLDNTRVVGNPMAVQGTEKAYDYVIENYNISNDGCFISGYSQGGHYAQNVIDMTDIPILAAAEQSPVCSMQYHQWDLNASVTVNNVKYSKAARLNVARIYGFPEFATNAELLKLAYDSTLVEEYDPWVRNSQNVYTGFVQKSNLWYLPEGTSVDDITMTHATKCPVKIWCAEDDTAISADVMKVFVKAIQNAGGTAEISIASSGGHGFFQKQTAVGTFTENGKTYNTLPIAVEIADWFAQYGGYEHKHTYENGICTGCGEAQPGPVITQQPVNGEAKLGELYMVEVKAAGEGLKYQWYFRNAGSSKWNKSSVKDNTYDDVMTTARAGREVYCVITDANGNSVTTDIVKLICLPSVALEIVTQPVNDEAVLGEDFCVTVEAKGDGLKYQWHFRNAGSDKWYKSSVKDNTYDDVMTKARAGREIYCVITDAYGNSVTTETVKLICIPTELEIISQPTSAEVSFGEMFCATVEAKGDGLKYQWYFRNSGTEKWYKSGVRDNTYDDVMTKARNHREIYCIITDMWGNSVTTDTVKLTAVPSVELKVLSQSYESAVMGERYCVTVEAQGDGLNYQWYFRNAGASRWSKSGVRDNTYDDVMNKTRANREVYCVISDACGNQITTEVITLTVEQ